MILKNLKRPICFVDIEATGLDVEVDRIVEITVCKIEVDGTRILKTKRLNPEMPISPSAAEVHGITDDMVANEKPFKSFAKSLHALIKDCDMAGFKSNNYDYPMLNNEFMRAGIDWDYRNVNFIDVGNIYHIKETRTLAAATKFYTGKDLENSHSSEADILATVDIFEKQLEVYEDLPKDLSELALYSNYGKINIDIGGKFYRDKDGEVFIGFGTHRGKPALTQQSWLEWLVSDKAKGFSAEVKGIANELLKEIVGE